MRLATRTIAIAASLTLIATAAQAQDTGLFSLEVRAGAALPTQDMGAIELDPALAIEFLANLQVMPHLNLYGGHSQAFFGETADLPAFDGLDECGYTFGARFFTPSFGAVTPWIRAGGVYSQLELESDDADDTLDSGHTLGWEAGVGAAVALGGRWSLLPGVRYRAVTHEMTEVGGEVDLSYVTLDLGISATFGGAPLAAIRHR